MTSSVTCIIQTQVGENPTFWVREAPFLRRVRHLGVDLAVVNVRVLLTWNLGTFRGSVVHKSTALKQQQYMSSVSIKSLPSIGP